MIGDVGTAVVMFPILRRYSETLSLSYVASRTIEATIIGVGAIGLLSVVTLRDGAGRVHWRRRNVAESRGSRSRSTDWTFLLGPGFCVGVNGILLGWMMYRTGLMPPRLAMLGVIGGPLIFLSAIAVLFGVYEQDGLHAFLDPQERIRVGVHDVLDRQGLQALGGSSDARFGGGNGSLRAARLRHTCNGSQCCVGRAATARGEAPNDA